MATGRAKKSKNLYKSHRQQCILRFFLFNLLSLPLDNALSISSSLCFSFSSQAKLVSLIYAFRCCVREREGNTGG
jgi:hypothetical protein